jgi:hypothetical protein
VQICYACTFGSGAAPPAPAGKELLYVFFYFSIRLPFLRQQYLRGT